MSACFSSFRGAPVDADQIGQSQLFFDLCAGARCILTECMRSDKALFDRYASISEGGSRYELDIKEQVRQALLVHVLVQRQDGRGDQVQEARVAEEERVVLDAVERLQVATFCKK